MRLGLVERAKAGDDSAFSALVDLDGGRTFAIAYRILRDADRAQDVVQQAFVRAWRDLPSLRDPERYEAWLYRILVRECYMEIRRHRRWSGRVRTLPMDGPLSGDPTGSVDDRDALDRAFARLSAEQRAVFVLHHHAGMPLGQVAEVVGAPIGTVKSRLHYATRSMRAAIVADTSFEAAEARTA